MCPLTKLCMGTLWEDFHHLSLYSVDCKCHKLSHHGLMCCCTIDIFWWSQVKVARFEVQKHFGCPFNWSSFIFWVHHYPCNPEKYCYWLYQALNSSTNSVPPIKIMFMTLRFFCRSSLWPIEIRIHERWILEYQIKYWYASCLHELSSSLSISQWLN